MKINPISTLLIKADNFCDYIPILSTVTNFIDLFQKCVILPFIPKPANLGVGKLYFLKEKDYYVHLNQKSFVRCALLLIPLFGQIIAELYYYDIEKSHMHKQIKKQLDNTKSFEQGKNSVSFFEVNDDHKHDSFALKTLQSHLPKSILIEKGKGEKSDLNVFFWQCSQSRPLVGFSSNFEPIIAMGFPPSAVIISFDHFDKNSVADTTLTVAHRTLTEGALLEEPLLHDLYKRGKVIFTDRIILDKIHKFGKPFSA